jgi:hypothetical protein
MHTTGLWLATHTFAHACLPLPTLHILDIACSTHIAVLRRVRAMMCVLMMLQASE